MLHNWHVSPITATAAIATVKTLAVQLLQGLQLRLLWFEFSCYCCVWLMVSSSHGYATVGTTVGAWSCCCCHHCCHRHQQLLWVWVCVCGGESTESGGIYATCWWWWDWLQSISMFLLWLKYTFKMSAIRMYYLCSALNFFKDFNKGWGNIVVSY